MSMIQQTDAIGGEITRHRLTHVDREASVLEASELMRKSGATELLVIDKSKGMLLAFGILTANDIVTRVIAAGLDPAVLTAGGHRMVWNCSRGYEDSCRYLIRDRDSIFARRRRQLYSAIRAAEHRFHTREKPCGIERLAQVVVSALLQ